MASTHTRSKSANRKANVLYIAFHFPPMFGSSGIHRTLVNARILSQNTQCNVLTCSHAAYDNIELATASLIPNKVNVIRAWARSTAKTFSFKGKYLRFMALPDNWQSWIPCGVIAGLWKSMSQKPDVIVSTYPITSALIIGFVLKKTLRVPWVVDLRDPMLQVDYPLDSKKRAIFNWIESKIVQHAKVVVVTTPGTKKLYHERFSNMPEKFWQIIPNGYDEMLFDDVEQQVHHDNNKSKDRPMTLLHSGVIYPSERDPNQFFRAIRELKESGTINSKMLTIRLRASGHDELFKPVLEQLAIADIVKLEPIMPYEKAVKEMFSVDSLLLLQDANCNLQIPAKVYEYIRVKKPILALTSKEGDTGQLLTQLKHAIVQPLDDKNSIKQGIIELIENRYTQANDIDVSKFGRVEQANNFVALLENVIASPDNYRR